MSMLDPMGTGLVGEAPAGSSSTAMDQIKGTDLNSLLSNLSDRANKGDEAALEKLFNYYSSEASAKTSREWTASREDTAYQRLIADLKKAGISPYILSGASPFAGGATQQSYSDYST